MFIFFSRNKANYSLAGQKGQITPFLIAILALVITAIMFTVNIGKVGLVKTYTSNAADAAALAGASTAATYFDQLALVSALMMASYYTQFLFISELCAFAQELASDVQSFLVSAAALAGVAYGLCVWGYALLLSKIGAAKGAALIKYAKILCAIALIFITIAGKYANLFKSVAQSIQDAVSQMHTTQQGYYTSIKSLISEMSTAIKNSAYSSGFLNSDISSKLKQDGEGNNNQTVFSNFLNTSNSSTAIIGPDYSWTDGQDRSHNVSIDVAFDPIDGYEFYTTMESSSSIDGRFNDLDLFTDTGIVLIAAAGIAAGACVSMCLKANYVAGAAAAAVVPWTFLGSKIGDVKSGVMENEAATVINPEYDLIPTTLKDVLYNGQPHSRQLSITSIQEHGSGDLGLWQEQYPLSQSSAQASFDGGVVDGHLADTGHKPRLIFN